MQASQAITPVLAHQIEQGADKGDIVIGNQAAQDLYGQHAAQFQPVTHPPGEAELDAVFRQSGNAIALLGHY